MGQDEGRKTDAKHFSTKEFWLYLTEKWEPKKVFMQGTGMSSYVLKKGALVAERKEGW